MRRGKKTTKKAQTGLISLAERTQNASVFVPILAMHAVTL